MSTLATQPEDEEAALARAIELASIRTIIDDLLPRATAIYGELKEGSEPQRLIGEFVLRARQFTEAGDSWYTGQYGVHPDWVGENIAPIILRWEEIVNHRRLEAATSEHVGIPGNAIISEATVTFCKSFENDIYGTRWLTIAKDERGNVLKYWNTFNVVDPIQSQATGTEVKRHAEKGDKIRFKATVKEHQIYKGVRGTVLRRARMVSLLKSAEPPAHSFREGMHAADAPQDFGDGE